MRTKLGILALLLCAACSRSHVHAGVDHDAPVEDESVCEVLVDEVVTERAYSSNRHIGVGPDGSVHVFFWDTENLIAAIRAPGGGWTEQVLQGQSLDSTDFPGFRVAAGGRPEPSLLLVGSYQTALWQLREGAWQRLWSADTLSAGSEAPIAVSPQGAAHFVLGSPSDDKVQHLFVMPVGADTPELLDEFSAVDPLLATDDGTQRHLLYRAATEPGWLYQAPDGVSEDAFTAENARPAFAVADGQVAALYRNEEGSTLLATRASGWQGAVLGDELWDECGEAFGDRPVEGQTCMHLSHRYSAWALAGGPRLALVAFERDEEGQRVADCSHPELGCTWVDADGFVDHSRLVFGTVGAAGVRLVEMPIEVPTSSVPSWRFALDQGMDGTLHMLLPAASEWEQGPLRYVRVRCDDT